MHACAVAFVSECACLCIYTYVCVSLSITHVFLFFQPPNQCLLRRGPRCKMSLEFWTVATFCWQVRQTCLFLSGKGRFLVYFSHFSIPLEIKNRPQYKPSDLELSQTFSVIGQRSLIMSSFRLQEIKQKCMPFVCFLSFTLNLYALDRLVFKIITIRTTLVREASV